uniref:Uncharacterized protein n=1 Tax=Rhizophora mucronata TaxID=61149 RepID=A0A2P2PZ06_RHIMU
MTGKLNTHDGRDLNIISPGDMNTKLSLLAKLTSSNHKV